MLRKDRTGCPAPSKTVPNPLTSKTVLITLCRECVKKGGARDPEVCDKLKPLLSAESAD